MNHSKRHGEILRLLQEEGTVTIASLADRLGVSLETVRRDVKPLTSDGSILKMHGAMGLPSMAGEAPFERRMRENADAKRAIASMVAATIRDGKSIMLDTGTTTSFLARELLGHRRLTVVTNSSDIARTLATVNGNKVYMAGGELRSDSGGAFGVSAIEFVSRFSVSPRGDFHRRGRCGHRRHGLRSGRGRICPHGAVTRPALGRHYRSQQIRSPGAGAGLRLGRVFGTRHRSAAAARHRSRPRAGRRAAGYRDWGKRDIINSDHWLVRPVLKPWQAGMSS